MKYLWILLVTLNALTAHASGETYRIVLKLNAGHPSSKAPSAPAWTPPVGEFALHPNGVTISCVGVTPGGTAEINDVTYTAVTEADLRSWHSSGFHQNAAHSWRYERACTSNVTHGTVKPRPIRPVAKQLSAKRPDCAGI